MFKKTILILLLLLSSLYGVDYPPYDSRLNAYPQAKSWSRNVTGESANNLGIFYDKKLHDKQKAIQWFKIAYALGRDDDKYKAAYNIGAAYDDLKEYGFAISWYQIALKHGTTQAGLGLGLLYQKLKRYDDAIATFKKAYQMGDIGSATALGYLYDVVLHDTKKGIKWYKLAAHGGDGDAINNLNKTYHQLGDKIRSAAYVMTLIAYGDPKSDVFDYIKNNLKLTQKEIKQAYQLQKTLDIPKHYYDSDLDNTPAPKKHRGRR